MSSLGRICTICGGLLPESFSHTTTVSSFCIKSNVCSFLKTPVFSSSCQTKCCSTWKVPHNCLKGLEFLLRKMHTPQVWHQCCVHNLIMQVPEVPYQEVPQEEQPPGLAQGGGHHKGRLWAAVLPDQQRGRGRRWGQRLSWINVALTVWCPSKPGRHIVLSCWLVGEGILCSSICLCSPV